MPSSESSQIPFQFSQSNHPRNSDLGQLIYPVNSRRAKGLSLGINLNPDKQCSFDCTYCQVIRPPKRASLSITKAQVLSELKYWLENLKDGHYKGHLLKDISIAGDGEPTQVTFLPELIPEIIKLRDQSGFSDRKFILFTNGTKIDRPDLQSALKLMAHSNGEIWIKLDFWDQESLLRLNQSKIDVERLKKKLIQVSQINPVVVQSCFFQIDQQEYNNLSYRPFVQNLKHMITKGFKIDRLQAYTLARKPANPRVYSWDNPIMDQIVALIRSECSIETEIYYASNEE